ncbi:unnamed protein product, partial [marine sediment metagenome]
KKGHTPINKGIIMSKEQKIKFSEARKGKYKGENNPFYGKKHTLETRERMKVNHPNVKGEENPMFGKKSVFSKLNIDKDFQKKRLKALNLKPNKPEKVLMNLLKKLNLPYKYVGDGRIIIDGFIPDFINYNGQKRIIELYGDYWHNLLDYKERDNRRKISYKKYGYDLLVVWQTELNNMQELEKKLIKFDRGKIGKALS